MFVIKFLNHSLNFIGKADQIDIGSAAGRTGNDFYSGFTETKGTEDELGGFDFFHRVGRQADADGVTDTLT